MKRSSVRIAVWMATCLVCASSGAAAQDEPSPSTRIPPDRDRLGWAAPDFVRLQSGGFLGMFNVGIGYSLFRDVINVGGAYGYVPPMNGARHVHIGTVVASVRPLRLTFGDRDQFYWYPLYVGAGGFIAEGPNVFVEQPSRYPAGYYMPTAIHYLVLVGMEFDLRLPKGAVLLRNGLYVEAVTIDQYLDALTQNRNVRLFNAFSTAIGYRASF